MYYAKVNWFDTYAEEDRFSFMFIPAKDWNDAMQKVTAQLEWINSIEMTELDSTECGVVFVPEHCVDDVTKENLS